MTNSPVNYRPSLTLYELSGGVDPQILITSPGGWRNGNMPDVRNAQAEQLYKAAVKTSDFFRNRFGYRPMDGSLVRRPMPFYWNEQTSIWTYERAPSGPPLSWHFHNKLVIEKLIAQEWMHQILENQWQHGALDEAISNIFAFAFYRWKYRKNMGSFGDWWLKTSSLQENRFGNSLMISLAFWRAAQQLNVRTRNECFSFNMPLNILWKVIPILNANASFSDYAMKSILVASRINPLVCDTLHEAFVHMEILQSPLRPSLPLEKKADNPSRRCLAATHRRS